VWLVNFGKHLQLKAVEYIQVREVKIELNSTAYWQADGEIYSSEVLHAKVIPGGLKLICG
jgi:diacylglycerol kinase family enzyme